MFRRFDLLPIALQLIFTLPCVFCEILLIDELLQNTSYDKRIRPYAGSSPVNISMNIELVQLGPIKEEDMTMVMTYYYRQWWNDPRLTLDGPIRADTISVHPANFIWVPDAKVVNAITLHEYPGYTRTIIKSNGDIYFSQRIKTKAMCNMQLQNYPMDSQRCFLQLESYAFNRHNMQIRWTNREMIVPSQKDLSLTGYDLTSYSREKIIISYGDIDKYDNLFAYFVVQRTYVYFVVKAYIPTILLAAFNIGSYFIPDTAEPARIALIITTFLANMVILQSVTEQTVKVPYTTAMQLFMLVNIFFLVIAILQYIVILYLRARKVKKLKVQMSRRNSYANDSFIDEKEDGKKNKLRMRVRKTEKLNNNVNHDLNHNGTTEKEHSNGTPEEFQNGIQPNEGAEDENQNNSQQRGDGVHILDEIFRILMPALYLVFCAIYFPYYLTAKESFQEE